jgi:MoxR-like ATPase
MPSDITGTEILDEDQGSRRLRFVKGPIFAQIILADEINRTPPKTQAALLEAMQEHHVTAAGRPTRWRTFFVLARRADRARGHLSLPEAQLDRMFNIVISYLGEGDEVAMVTKTTGAEAEKPVRVLSGPDILRYQELCRQVVIAKRSALRGAARGPCAPAGQARPVRREMGEMGRRIARARRSCAAARPAR